MTLARLMLRSLWRFRRSNLGVMLGVACSTAVITGALLVGDSMRYTLQQAADQRLGDVSHAIIGGDRFFTRGLAESLESSSGAVLVTGVVSSPDGQRRANDVQVNGIDDMFGALLGGPARPAPGEAVLNRALAEQLGAQVGDTLVLRVPEPSALPVDAALVNASKPARAIRLTVSAVSDASSGGRFSLRAEQRTPMNLFVDRTWLAEQLGVPGRANAALLSTPPGPVRVTLDDLELRLSAAPDGRRALTSPRVFLDASIEADLADLPGQRLLTYMVNTVSLGDRRSPYAMVTAADDLGDLGLGPNDIAINQWLADDLQASVGDTLTLTYYLPDEGDRLVEASTTLTVARIVPIEGAFADRTLTPDFPGLAEADRLSRWDAGPAIDRTRIRDGDEAYWDDYRATPKAFIALQTGQRLWANRFGTLTAIRLDAPVTNAAVLEAIDPAPLGFAPIDVRAQADAAAVGTVDFAQLFLSLSGFIIIAGVVLTATLFAMSVEQRARQLGTLSAIGLTRRQLGALMLSEGSAVAIVGASLGLFGGWLYTAAVIDALNGRWSGAVAGTPLIPHATPMSLIAGPVGALCISVMAMAWTLRVMIRRPARELLSGAVGRVSGSTRLPVAAWWCVAGLMSAAAIGLAVSATSASGMRAGLLGFGGGAALFVALACALYARLCPRLRADPRATTRAAAMSLSGLARRNLTRRRGRTLAAVVTLGCGVFLVLAVAGFRLSAQVQAGDRASGTGGFALIVEASQPIPYDLNTALGRDHYALGDDELPAGSVLPMRVNGGDDASCLNLNQTPTPRVIGVDAALLVERDAFTFQNAADHDARWQLLRAPAPTHPDAVPAIADANTAQWALKLAVGDTLELTDELGRPFTIELVGTIENSILQGSLIIDERAFERLYPGTSGHRLLLVDAVDAQQTEARAALLAEVLVDEGVSITPTSRRLAEYNQVQNTYLSIFQALGGLGVVLGALGLGVIAARNLIERRAELALLVAVGFSRRRIAGLAMIEHGGLLLAGLLFGGGAAWLATSHAGGAVSGLGVTALRVLLATLAAGLGAVLLGLRSAWSGRLIDALRSD